MIQAYSFTSSQKSFESQKINCGLSDSHSLRLIFPFPSKKFVSDVSSMSETKSGLKDSATFLFAEGTFEPKFWVERQNLERNRTKATQSGIHFLWPEWFRKRRRNIAQVVIFSLFLLVVLINNAFAESARELKVGVAVAPSYQIASDWKDSFERRLAYASKIFDSELNITFTPVRYMSWVPSNESDMNILADELQSKFPLNDLDIVIGLTSFQFQPGEANDSHLIGRAKPFGGYLVIRRPVEPLFKIQEEMVLIHELGHLFGAVHVQDESTIMAPVVNKEFPTQFDPINREILSVTRGIDFKEGNESLDLQTIETLIGSYNHLIASGQPFDFYYSLGNFYLKLGQGQNALEPLKKALEMNPDNARTHYDLGVLLIKLGDQNEAINHLTTAAALFQRSEENEYKANALYMIGNAHFGQQNYLAAQAAWQQALALRPDDLDLLTNLGVSRLMQKDYVTAIQNLLEVVSRGGNNASVYGSLGAACYETGEYGRAVDYFRKALEAPAPLNTGPISALDVVKPAQIYLHLGFALMKNGQGGEAAGAFEKACSLDPSTDCHKNLGQVYFQMQNWDAAIRELGSVLNSYPNDVDIYGMLGAALMKKNAFEDAETLYKNGIQNVSDSRGQAALHISLGDLYLRQRNSELATEQFRRAVDKDWNNVNSHVGLAMSYLQQNQVEPAKDALRHALAIDANHPDARNLMAQIEAHSKG